MIPVDFDNLLGYNRDMWGFQVRLSSKKTPKNMVSETRRIGCSFTETWNSNDCLFCQGLNTIKLVLDKFKESRFAANQVDNLFNSLFNVLIR